MSEVAPPAPVEEQKPTYYQLKTASFDARFPNQNQTKNCWQNYVDYHKCMKIKGDEQVCLQFKKTFTSLCPIKWVERWDEQREEGVFVGLVERKDKGHH
jgi:cytochrome c oxidase subunit 6b